MRRTARGILCGVGCLGLWSPIVAQTPTATAIGRADPTQVINQPIDVSGELPTTPRPQTLLPPPYNLAEKFAQKVYTGIKKKFEPEPMVFPVPEPAPRAPGNPDRQPRSYFTIQSILRQQRREKRREQKQTELWQWQQGRVPVASGGALCV